MAEDLEIRLLGDLEVVRNGKRQALPASKKTRALLGYLATNEKEFLRESLCTLLWEGPDDPRAALRWSLTKLRPLLDGETITRLRADRDRARFEPQGAKVDLHEIHSMLGREVASAPTTVLRNVVPKFRGIFLEGLDLAGAYPWNEWLRGQRETTRSLLTTVRTALVQRNWETQPEEALVHARALLALDPLTESAHIQVIRLLGILGRNKEAKEEYARCRLMLQTEFGSQPSAELEATRMALGSQRRPPQTLVAVPSKLPEKVEKVRASAPPLVGRIAEENVLGERIASAAKGSAPKVILLVGEPGIGKTRLIEDMQGKVVTMGGVTLVGRSFEAEMVRPYGAWLDALGAFLAPTALHAEIPPLLMGSGASVAIDRPRLFEAMAHYFDRCITEGGWLTIILDDIQWLDDGSVGLFHFLIRALAGKPVLFACAARPGELGDNPAALRLIRALDREQRLLQINIEPLTLDQTAELARFVDPDSDVGRVFTECEGNPLFCIEFTNALRGGKSAVPETIGGILDERLNRMGDRARALLPWAAALGRGFDPEKLAKTSGMPPADLVSALDELERRGVVRTSPQSGTQTHYDFAHDLIRRAAYQQMSAPRRRMVHLQTARALAGIDDPTSDRAGEVAHHASLGEEPLLAVRSFLAAADRSVRLFASTEAQELARRGLRLVARLPRELRIPLHIKLLHALIRSSFGPLRGESLRTIDSELIHLTIEAQDAGLHAEAAFGFYLLSELRFDTGNFAGAAEVTLQAAAVGQSADPGTALRRMLETARCLTMLEREMPRVQDLLRVAREWAGPRAEYLLDLSWTSGLFHHFLGERGKAMTDLECALTLAGKAELRWEEYECLLRLVLVDLESGPTNRAFSRSKTLIELAAKMSNDSGGSESAMAHALCTLAQMGMGQPEANANVESALLALQVVDAKGMMAIVLNLAAEMDLARGQLDLALRRGTDALAMASAVNRRSQMTLARATLAEIALESGDRNLAIGHVRATENDLAYPLMVSGRAHARIHHVANRLSIPIPTPTSTVAQTPMA